MEKNNIELIIKSITENKPLFIKNFNDNLLSFNNKTKLIEQINFENNNLYGMFYSNFNDESNINKFKNLLKNQENFIVNKNIRIWNHKKNNLTILHYDFGCTNVINICLKEKKQFILTPPSNNNMIPFTTISLFDISNSDYTYIIEENDLLLIPSNWNHKVITLEDACTINYTIVDKNIIIDDYRLMQYKLHRIINTGTEIFSIFKIANLQNIKPFQFIYYFINEIKIYFILILFFEFFKYITFISLNIVFCLLFFIFIILNYNKNEIKDNIYKQLILGMSIYMCIYVCISILLYIYKYIYNE